jgi:hypothetical protein
VDFGTPNSMTKNTRRIVSAAAALLSAPLFLVSAIELAPAQGVGANAKQSHQPALLVPVRAKHGVPDPKIAPPPQSSSSEPAPRVAYTAAEAAAATIPGIPEARFWADSVEAYKAALPQQPGPWLILSSGGADGAFGAGLLTGLTHAGKRPDYAVVTGVSTGALMAPFIFAGTGYDDALHNAYTQISAADVFEAGRSTGESFVDSWPLRDFIAKQVTPALLDDVAAAHRAGRRLFIVTSNLDSERSMVWNMGAIAAHGGDDAIKLFRAVLLASASVPGGFPPVLIDVEANGKHFQEMHVDGGLGGQFFVGPPALMAATSDYRLPAKEIYVVINTGLKPIFKVVDRFAPTILTQAIGMAVPVDTRLMMNIAYAAAKRSDVPFNVAVIPDSFNVASKGPFDPDYMKALFQAGFNQAQSGQPFGNEPPAYPDGPAHGSTKQQNPTEKTGASQ